MKVGIVLQMEQVPADGGSGVMFAGRPPILEGVNMADVMRRLSGTSARPTISSGVLDDVSTIRLD